MKKKIVALTLALMLILTSFVSATSLKDFIDQNFVWVNSENGVKTTTKSIDADLWSKLSTDKNYENENLEGIEPNEDAVDFKAEVLTEEIKTALASMQTVILDDKLKADFNEATIEGEFVITITANDGADIVIPEEHKTGASLYGFTDNNSGGCLALFEEVSRDWNNDVYRDADTLKMKLKVKDDTTVAQAMEGIDDLYYTMEGVTFKRPGDFKITLDVTGYTNLISGGEVAGKINYNFKQRNYTEPPADAWIDPDGSADAITVQVHSPGAYMEATPVKDGKFTVTVNVANNPGITNLSWSLRYDPTIVKPSEFDDGTFAGVGDFASLTTNYSSDAFDVTNEEEINVVGAYTDTVGTTQNGKAFAVEFNVFGAPSDGNIEITLIDNDGSECYQGTFYIMDKLNVKYDTININLYDQDGATLLNTLSGLSGTTVTLPTPDTVPETTLGSYSFLQWQDEINDKVYYAEDEITLVQDMKLVAKYEYIPGTAEITATEAYYVDDSGSDVKALSATTGDSYLYLNDKIYAKFDVTDWVGKSESPMVVLSLLHKRRNGYNHLCADVVSVTDFDGKMDLIEAGTATKDNVAITGTNLVKHYYTGQSEEIKGQHENAILSGTTISSAINNAVKGSDGKAYIALKIYVNRDDSNYCLRTYDFMTGSKLICSTLDSVTVTYKDSKGKNYQTANVDLNSKITLIDGPVHPEGYFFTGWTINGSTYAAGYEYTVGWEPVTITPEYDEGILVTLANAKNENIRIKEAGTVTLPEAKVSTIGTYGTFEGWRAEDGSIYDAETEVSITEDTTFTALWSYTGVSAETVKFDSKYLVNAGKWDAATSTYDDEIKSVEKITDETTLNVNANRTMGDNGYRNRPFVYVALDLKGAQPATTATLNFSAKTSGSATNNGIRVEAVDLLPEKGDTLESSTAYNTVLSTGDSTTYTLKITDLYNAKIGSTLYLKVYGYAYTIEKPQNYVSLSCGDDKFNLTVTTDDNPLYTATLKDGDTVNNTYTGYAGETFVLPTLTGATGVNTFMGWSDGTTTHGGATVYTLPANNVTLNAEWKSVAETWSINLVTAAGGEHSQSVDKDASYTLPDLNDKEGWTFAGWTIDDGESTLTDTALTIDEATAEGKTYKAMYTKNIAYGDVYHANLTNIITKNPTGMFKLPRTKGGNSTHNGGMYTTVDLSGIDTQILKVTWYHTYAYFKQGTNTIYAYEVTGDYSSVFKGLTDGVASTEALDLTGLTIDTTTSGSKTSIATKTTLTNGEWELTGLEGIFNTKIANDKNSVQLVVKTVGSGTANNDHLQVYANSEKPSYFKIYALAGAPSI